MAANFARHLLFTLRRERVISLIWLVALVVSAAGFAAMYPSLFPTQEALVNMAAGLDTPAMVAMMGPVYGMEALTPAIAMAQECLIWFAIAIIVMNIFLVNRHTRVDEELGRHELLVSLPVGRMTGSLAALVCAFGLDLAISLFSALSIIGLDIEGTTVAGAFCYAFSFGAQGFLFAAIALLAAQLFSTAHGASGFSFAVMGLFYILRASGDMAGNALSYLSPMGLGLKVQAFYLDDFWPVVVLFVEAIVVAGVALLIGAQRDIGTGIFPARKGRARASAFLRGPFGLAWRLVRRTALVWAIAVFVLGACYGTVVGELDKFVEGNQTIQDMLTALGGGTASLVESYVPMLSGIMGILCCVPVIGAMGQLRAEERRGRLEQVYSKSVSRCALFGSFAVIATVEAVVYMLLTAVGLYSTSAGTGLLHLDTLLIACLLQVPAMLVLAGVSALLIGVAPRWSHLVWAVFGYSFLMLYFGRLFKLSDAAIRLSPFGNLPLYPIDDFAPAPVVALTALAAALFVAGYLTYRRRDLQQ